MYVPVSVSVFVSVSVSMCVLVCCILCVHSYTHIHTFHSDTHTYIHAHEQTRTFFQIRMPQRFKPKRFSHAARRRSAPNDLVMMQPNYPPGKRYRSGPSESEQLLQQLQLQQQQQQ